MNSMKVGIPSAEARGPEPAREDGLEKGPPPSNWTNWTVKKNGGQR